MESIKPFWTALVGYVFLSLILTYPMILSPIDTVVGHEYASVACHIWVLWWAREHLRTPDTDLIFYPHGADVVQLYGSDLLSPPILAQIPLPFGLLYNGWVLFLLVVGAMGARQLGLYFTLGQRSAGIAGVLFCTAPFFQHEMLNGTSELLSTGLLPWYSLLFLSMLDEPTPRKSVGIGLVAGVLLSLSAYNPFFLLLISLVFLIFRLTSQTTPIFTKALWRNSLWAGMVFLPFLFGVASLQLLHGAGETFSRRSGWLDTNLALPDSYASLFDWFDPRETELPALLSLPNGNSFAYWTTCTVYIGWVAVFAIVWGWNRAKRGPLRMLQWLLLLSMLIAMGPYLRVDNEVWTIFGWTIFLPAYTIGYLFPLFAITAIHAYRYSAVVVLSSSILAAQRLASLGWIGAIVIEILLLAPQPYPAAVTRLPDSTVLEYLATQPDGAVFTYPIKREDLHDLGQVLLAQTVHGKPIHDGGIHGRAGFEATALFRDNFVVDQLSARRDIEYPTEMEATIGFQDLYQKGYRYVLCTTENQEALHWGISVLGEPVRQDQRWALWPLAVIMEL